MSVFKNRHFCQTFLIFILIMLITEVIGHSHSHSHSHHSHTPLEEHAEEYHEKSKYFKEANLNQNMVWMEALASTAFISIAPFLLLFLIPIDNTSEHHSLLKILLSLASGGLLGDAFLHLIPHALIAASHDSSDKQNEHHHHTHSHSHGHSHGPEGHNLSVGLLVLGGILTFLVIEKIARAVKGNHGHGHSHEISSKEVKTDKIKNKSNDDKKEKLEPTKKEEVTSIQVAGWLNLVADIAHNVTDGLAIGAAYHSGRGIGVATTAMIFLHEIPHEIGDLAILVKSGCTKRKAILLQLITAVGALGGTLFSLMAYNVNPASLSWIEPFTAGGFIYVAAVSIIPELLTGETRTCQSIMEVASILLGVVLMAAIAYFE